MSGRACAGRQEYGPGQGTDADRVTAWDTASKGKVNHDDIGHNDL